MSPLLLAAPLLAPALYWSALKLVNGSRRAGEPPLVTGKVPHLGAAVSFGKDALTFLSDCRAKHGEVFTLFIAGQRMTFVLDPMAYPAVLKNKDLSFDPIAEDVVEKAFAFPNMRERVDIPKLEALAKTWLKGEELPGMTDRVAEVLHRELGKRVGEDWAEIDLYRFVWDVMFEVGTDVIFGRGIASEKLARDFEAFDADFPLLVGGLPALLAPKGHAALASLPAQLAELGEDPSQWVLERKPAIDPFSPEDRGRLRLSILWAANANTIPAAFWTILHLWRQPEALKAVHEELEREARGDEGEWLPFTAERLDRMRMLDSAAREALRLSTGSLTVRTALRDTTLEFEDGRHTIREGDRVCLAPYYTHHDPEIFEDPLRYRHDRFYVESGVKTFTKGDKRVPIPLMPFGAGHSMCPGRFLALNEIKLYAAMVLSTLEVDKPPAEVPDFERTRVGLGIFPPAHDVSVRVRRLA